MSAPVLSVVIPTYRRPVELERCLAALAAQEMPRERFEVLVVDDGGAASNSPSDSERVVSQVRDKIEIRLLKQDRSGPAAARNRGAREATGDMVAFTDDDCEAAADWLLRLEERALEYPGFAIGGRTVNKLVDNPYASASQLLIDFLYGYYNPQPDRASFFTSSNLAFPREALLGLGGFDTGFRRAAGEDREIWDRWRERGLGMVLAPEVRVLHSHELGLRSFWRQHFGYGRGAWLFHRRRAERGGDRVRLEPLAFYLGLLRYPSRAHRGVEAFRLTALMALTQVANAMGFLWERMAQSGRSLGR